MVNHLNLIIEHIADEFSKMKDEVPPALIESHVKMVESAEADGKSVSPEFWNRTEWYCWNSTR